MPRPLKAFMRGKNVRFLHQLLRQFGYVIEDADGLFGVDTRDAVKHYQTQHSLTSNGEVDAAMMHRLQHGMMGDDADLHAVQTDKAPDTAAHTMDDAWLSQQKLDILVGLLEQKGVLAAGEFESALQNITPKPL